VGAADHEPAGRIDQELGPPAVEPGLLEHRTDDLADHRILDGVLGELAIADPLRMLGRYDDGAHRDRGVALVLDRDLALAVGPEPLELVEAAEALPDRGEPLGDPMREDDRERHPLAGL